uniref:ABC transporter domain-containing protein n=1 Tax=OCS116 cluster bacterium TaxID=2030921 RepID=A0A2A4YU18_9PROT
MAKVILKGIRKSYGPIEVLSGIDLTIENGDFAVILGPSGCGKTTLLRTIAGLETANAGSIQIGERIVDDIPAARRQIGMVFQTYALFPHLNVYQNISFGMRMRNEPKDQIEQRVQEAAVKLKLEDYLKRLPRELSGGQRQRVAIGRALVREPEVFLFDEPLSNLDAELRVDMRLELSALHQQLKATMIYVTHDQVEAMTLGTKIIVLDKGVLQQVGTPLEVYYHPANKFVAGFVGSPRMRFIPGEVVSNADNKLQVRAQGILSGDIAFDLEGSDLSEGDFVDIGVRAEDIECGQATNGMVSFSGISRQVENMGHSSFWYGTIKDTEIEIIARLGKQTQVKSGAQMEFSIDPRNLYLFDSDGRAILRNVDMNTELAEHVALPS